VALATLLRESHASARLDQFGKHANDAAGRRICTRILIDPLAYHFPLPRD
jgi:hypothetical protein